MGDATGIYIALPPPDCTAPLLPVNNGGSIPEIDDILSILCVSCMVSSSYFNSVMGEATGIYNDKIMQRNNYLDATSIPCISVQIFSHHVQIILMGW